MREPDQWDAEDRPCTPGIRPHRGWTQVDGDGRCGYGLPPPDPGESRHSGGLGGAAKRVRAGSHGWAEYGAGEGDRGE